MPKFRVEGSGYVNKQNGLTEVEADRFEEQGSMLVFYKADKDGVEVQVAAFPVGAVYSVRADQRN